MKRILIVDDSPDFLDALSYILKKHYEVTTAGGVAEAKAGLLTSAFDVICSDYYMADGTGLDLLEFCKQEKISVSFILMSATWEQHIVYRSKIIWGCICRKD
ncbi:response regulator [Lachnospiraceae bacterium]|nr:response regulator [Lachnospiraceae bacterium]